MSPWLPRRSSSDRPGQEDPGASAGAGRAPAAVTLADLLGALAADITAARAQADATAVRIAQVYREDPLLRTLPVPHFRLADLTITMPLAVRSIPAAAGGGSAPTPDEGAAPPDRAIQPPGGDFALPSIGVEVAATTAEVESARSHEALMQLRVNFSEHGLEWAVGEDHERLVPE
jgi:hypothetical protein